MTSREAQLEAADATKRALHVRTERRLAAYVAPKSSGTVLCGRYPNAYPSGNHLGLGIRCLGINLRLRWWAHKGSNLGPAD
jgi:hypothetical protein